MLLDNKTSMKLEKLIFFSVKLKGLTRKGCMKPLLKEHISHIHTSPDICLLIEKNMHAQLNEIGTMWYQLQSVSCPCMTFSLIVIR